MKTLLLKNAEVIFPDHKESTSVLIVDGRIAQIGSVNEDVDNIVDLSGCALYPGFIDIHIHGAVGVDVMEADAAALEKMAAFLTANGVTAWMPTFVPDSEENYRRSIAAIDEFIGSQKGKPVAQAVGVHYEGPFVNEHQCGALRPQYFLKFENGDEVSKLPKLASDNVKHFTTAAPEGINGIDLVRKLVSEDWIVSIGHTRADIATLDAAQAAGAKHMTHFFNAMSGLHHRDVGAVGWGFMNADVTCDVIADGVHVNPQVLKLLHQVKGADSVALISDSVLPAGLGDGNYEIWSEKISVVDGKTQNERGSIAGSVITMLDAVRRMLSLGMSESDVAKMASLTPAKVLGLEDERGSIEVGKRADLVALDANGNVVMSVVFGNMA